MNSPSTELRKLAHAYLAVGIAGCLAAVGMVIVDVRASGLSEPLTGREVGAYLLQALPYGVWLCFYWRVRKQSSKIRLWTALSIGFVLFILENVFRYAALFATDNEHAAMSLLVLPYWTAFGVLFLLMFSIVAKPQTAAA
jgi:hypothetical protein